MLCALNAAGIDHNDPVIAKGADWLISIQNPKQVEIPWDRSKLRATEPAMRLADPALNAVKGCVGYPSALTAKTWGFYDVLFKGNAFQFERPFGSYVMENVLFKISFPAEFHAQTAVECAMQLHSQVAGRIDQIERWLATGGW